MKDWEPGHYISADIDGDIRLYPVGHIFESLPCLLLSSHWEELKTDQKELDDA